MFATLFFDLCNLLIMIDLNIASCSLQAGGRRFKSVCAHTFLSCWFSTSYKSPLSHFVNIKKPECLQVLQPFWCIMLHCGALYWGLLANACQCLQEIFATLSRNSAAKLKPNNIWQIFTFFLTSAPLGKTEAGRSNLR